MNPVFAHVAIRYGPAVVAATAAAIAKICTPVEELGWSAFMKQRAGELVGQLPKGVKVATAVTVGVAAISAAAAHYYGMWRRRVVFAPLCQESLVPHSTQVIMREPRCQVSLAYEANGTTLEAVGAGLRVTIGPHHCLLTAMHNLAYDKPLWLVKGENQMCLGKVDYISLAADAALVVVPEKVFSVLGVKVATLSPMLTATQTVTIVGIAGKGTTGTLRASDVAQHGLGHVEYKASTYGGYSGAPYMSGNSAYGMHTHGGARNGGYSLLYLYCIAKIELKHDEEDSDDAFLRRLFNDEDEVWYHHIEERGDDKLVVKTRSGHYHVVDKKRYYEIDAEYDIFSDSVARDRAKYVPEHAPGVNLIVEQPKNCHCPGLQSRAGVSIPLSLDKPPQTSVSSSTIESEQPSQGLQTFLGTRSLAQLERRRLMRLQKQEQQLNGNPSTSNPVEEPKPSRAMSLPPPS